ncbi:unnamed protein product, partial [Clonostachys rhizophaga]
IPTRLHFICDPTALSIIFLTGDTVSLNEVSGSPGRLTFVRRDKPRETETWSQLFDPVTSSARENSGSVLVDHPTLSPESDDDHRHPGWLWSGSSKPRAVSNRYPDMPNARQLFHGAWGIDFQEQVMGSRDQH